MECEESMAVADDVETMKSFLSEKWWHIGIILFCIILFFFVGWPALVPLLIAACFPLIVFPEESTAMAIIRFGAFRKLVSSCKDHKFDDEWNVTRGKEIHILGGARIAGFLLIDKVYKYCFRWRGLELVEGEEEIVPHAKIINFILLRADTFLTSIIDAETIPPERIRLTIYWLVTMRSVNPYKTLFRAPPNWNENALSRLNAVLANWTGTKKYDEVIKIRESGKEAAWEQFKDDPLIIFLKEKWGIEIVENGIQIQRIIAPKYLEESASRQREMEFEAAGRAAKTVGTVIAQMAAARGKKPEEIQAEIEKSDELKKEFLTLAKDLTMRQLAIEGKSFVDVRVNGPGGAQDVLGLERIFLETLAIFGRMQTGSSSGTLSGAGGAKEQKTRQEGVKDRREGGPPSEESVDEHAKRLYGHGLIK